MLWAGVQYTHTFKSHLSYFSGVILHHHNSPGNWARELFKHSRDAEKRGDDLKNWEVLDLFFFVGDVIKRSFRHFWPTSSGPGPQPKETIFCFSFLNQISWNSTLGRANCGLMSQISMLSWSKFAVEQLLFEVSSVNIFMETNQKIKNCTISTLKMPEQFLF